MSDQRKSSSATIAIALALVLLLPPGLYLGAYYALLVDQISLASPPPPGVPFDPILRPVYRNHYPVVESALEPAHQVDRILRPGYWQ